MEIVDWLREKGRVTVEDLATHFTVTPQTIRRDLNDLSDAQMVVRVHGGAIVSSGVVNLAYDARKMLAGPHKKLIGEAAARVIPDHSSVFINIGTTTEEVARALAGHSGLLVITNNLQRRDGTLPQHCDRGLSARRPPSGRATAASSDRMRSTLSDNSASTSPSSGPRPSMRMARCSISTSVKFRRLVPSSNMRAGSCS